MLTYLSICTLYMPYAFAKWKCIVLQRVNELQLKENLNKHARYIFL